MSTNLVDQPGCPAGKLEYLINCVIREDIMVSIGGVIPVQDYDFLYEHGAVAIFAPGTNIPEAGIKLLTLLIDRAKEETAEA